MFRNLVSIPKNTFKPSKNALNLLRSFKILGSRRAKDPVSGENMLFMILRIEMKEKHYFMIKV